jgi:hypothetical protein
MFFLQIEIYRSMLKKLSLLILGVALFAHYSISQTQFGTLSGRITDNESGEPLPFANVVIILNGVQKGGAATDMDGSYTIKPVVPGTYDIHVTYIGYAKRIIQNVEIASNRITYQNFKLSQGEGGVTTKTVIITDYVKPLIEQDNTSTGGRLSSEEIKKAPTRSVGDLVGLTAGVLGSSFKGQRSSGTAYYVDGVKMIGYLGIPNSSMQEVNTMTGGIPAEYGDITGGVVSITTRGPSSKYHGAIEMITSQFLDPYGYNTLEGNLSGPILLKDKRAKGTDSAEAMLGFLVSGNINFRKDGSPTAEGLYKVKNEWYDYLYNNPLSPSPSGVGYVPTAEYITKYHMEKIRYRPNVNAFSYNLNAKLDFQPADNMNITAGGQIARSVGKGWSYTHSLYNYEEASKAQSIDMTYRGYVRFTQTFKNEEAAENPAETPKNKLKISNAFYTLMFDYTKLHYIRQHEDFKDDFFKYGHLGTYERYWEPVYRIDSDTINGKIETAYVFLGNRDTLLTFAPSGYNTGRANYTSQLMDLTDGGISNLTQLQLLQGLRNGDAPQYVYSLWANVGSPAAAYSVQDIDQYRISGQASADLNKHEIKIGFEYEQRVQRYFGITSNLWTQMRQLTNAHILSLDTENPIPVYSEDGIFLDTITYQWFNDGSQSTFDMNFRNYLMSTGARDVYGNPIDEYSHINIDRYSPDVFSLDMFAPDELLELGMVGYYGFTYTGEKLKKNPSIEDFLNNPDERLIAPLNPIYMAGYIQDQFSFKDIIFRLGLRVDRFDANQVMLVDEYSLYPARSAGEVKEINGNPVSHPGNIGRDYVVYVDNPFNPTEMWGDRERRDNNDDIWYDAKGAEVADPNIIALETSTGTIAPYLYVQNEDDLELTTESFKDYEPQVNLSPRVSFSFPISTEANFFANYDIRVQRPTAGIFTTIDQYYFMEQRGTSVLPNAGLKPQKVTSYELGFVQALNTNMAITFNAYYNETRDQINIRMLNQAYPRSYMTYDNIDFQTAKGFSVSYDLRKTPTNNVSMQANYTLAFADGTGSNEASQAGLVQAGQPNLRTPFPLSNDRRHQISAMIDYRFRPGRLYNGPVSKNGKKILENTGVNFLISATSGAPYSKQGNVTQAVAIGIRQSEVLKGTLNGARAPWNFSINMRIDRSYFFQPKKKKDGARFASSARGSYLNVYIWVQNLFDIRNISGIYRYTGDHDDDGFLSSSLGLTAIEEATNSQAFFDQYSVKVNNPYNLSTPRLVRLGATFNF